MDIAEHLIADMLIRLSKCRVKSREAEMVREDFMNNPKFSECAERILLIMDQKDMPIPGTADRQVDLRDLRAWMLASVRVCARRVIRIAEEKEMEKCMSNISTFGMF